MSRADQSEAWSLPSRLRGRYPVGPRLASGEPEMGWREFPPVNVDGSPASCRPAIHEEAAKRIEELEAAIREWAEVQQDADDFDGDRRGILAALREREVALAALVGIELESDEDA